MAYTFDLFRIRVVKTGQMTFFTTPGKSPQQVLIETLKSTTFSNPYLSQEWRIADVKDIEGGNIYLRIGRTRKTALERLEGDHFTAELVDNMPSTHALIDIERELCGIVERPAVAQKTQTIARALVDVLNMNTVASDEAAKFEIGPIPETAPLIHDVETADEVVAITIEFTRPNLFDEDEHVWGPLQNATQELGAEKGIMTISGKDLNKSRCEALIKIGARLGQAVKAKLRLSADPKIQSKSLMRGNAKITVPDIVSETEKQHALEQLVSKFESIGGIPAVTLNEGSQDVTDSQE